MILTIMPYLDIVFHNIQHGGLPVNRIDSRRHYSVDFVAQMNVFQSNAGPGSIAAGIAPPSAGWGGSVTSWGVGHPPASACGIFFCESQDYTHADYANWQGDALRGIPTAIPVFPVDYIMSGYTPIAALNTLCAFLEGNTENPAVGVPVAAGVPPVYASAHWFGNQALRCLGTGAAPLLDGNALWGSDRYGILFQAARRTYPDGNAITGFFVHIKNTNADPGTQIAALCTNYPNSIIFGDLNFNLRTLLQERSLREAVRGTHTILAIQQVGGIYYHTRYVAPGGGTSCIDYALVPNAQVANVELWAQRIAAAATLFRNGSDHSVMMLRIRCN